MLYTDQHGCLFWMCRPCIAAVIAFVIAQVLKVFTYWYSERRWDATRLIGSGGMPSSHTGCVSVPSLLHTSPSSTVMPPMSLIARFSCSMLLVSMQSRGSQERSSQV